MLYISSFFGIFVVATHHVVDEPRRIRVSDNCFVAVIVAVTVAVAGVKLKHATKLVQD